MYGISVLLFSFTPFVFKLKWHHGKVTEDPSVSFGLDPRWDPRLDSLVHSRPFEIILPIYSIGRIVFAKKWTNRPPMVTPLVTRWDIWASRPPLHSLLRAQSLTGEIKNSCCDVKREYLGGVLS